MAKKTGYAPALYEYNGLEKTAAEWSTTLGINTSTFRGRMKKFNDGDLACIDDVYKPAEAKPLVPVKAEPKALANPFSKGARVRALAELFQLYEELCKPNLRAEMQSYMATGEMGPAMKFFQLYKDFFPKDKSELLDGETGTPVATVAVVFNTAAAPSNITIIDS